MFLDIETAKKTQKFGSEKLKHGNIHIIIHYMRGYCGGVQAQRPREPVTPEQAAMIRKVQCKHYSTVQQYSAPVQCNSIVQCNSTEL